MHRQEFLSSLMIVYHVSDIIFFQTYDLILSNEFYYPYKPIWFDPKRCIWLYEIAYFLSSACFTVAHQWFAFNYLKLSYKQKLKNDGKPVDTN